MNPSDQPASNDPIPNIPPATPPFEAPAPTPPGAPPPPPQSQPQPPPQYTPPPQYDPPPAGVPGGAGFAGVPTPEEKNWALAAHMSALVMLLSIPGVVGPLIVWLIKKDTMPYVNEHGKEALNFQLTHFFVMLACVAIGLITCTAGFVVTLPIMILDGVFAIVMAIIAGLKAGNGEFYRYPLCWRIIK